MKTATRTYTNWWNSLALFFLLPALFFISIAVLKYEMGVDQPFDSVAPFLEDLGIKEPLPGFNINLLIVFGPVVAIAIALFQVLKIGMHFSKPQWDLHIQVQKRWFPLLIIAAGGLVMLVLFLYAVGENCNC